MKQTSFFKELFIFRKPNEDKFQLIGAGICMAIPLFIGYFTNNPAIGNFGSLGIFTFLYYKRLPFKNFLTYLSLIGIFLLLGNLVGILSSSIEWLIPITIASVAFLARIIFRIYQIEKPGAFFIVMVTSMGTSMALPVNQIPLMMSYFFLGIVVSLLVASIIFFINRKKELPKSESIHWKTRLHNDPSALLDALNYASILFLASYLSQSFQLPNAYWMTVSCAAVLQGENLKAIMHRNVQRILGTIIGVLIAGILLSLPLTFLQTIFLICFLFVAVEFFCKTQLYHC